MGSSTTFAIVTGPLSLVHIFTNVYVSCACLTSSRDNTYGCNAVHLGRIFWLAYRCLESAVKNVLHLHRAHLRVRTQSLQRSGGVLAERLHLHSQLSLVRSALALLRRPLHLARRLHLVHAQRKLQECPHRQCSCQRVDRRPALRQPDCPGQHGLRWSHVRSIPPASRAPASVINGLSAAAYTHSFSSSPSSASLPKSTAINKAVWAPAVCRFWPLANRKPSLSIHGSLVPSSCHDGKSLSVPFVAPGKSLKTRCASYLYIVVHLQ